MGNNQKDNTKDVTSDLPANDPLRVDYAKAGKLLAERTGLASSAVPEFRAAGKALEYAGAALTLGLGGSGAAAASGGAAAAATAQGAGVAAAAGPAGLVVAGVLLGTAAALAIAGAVRQGQARALAVSEQYGGKGRDWGRAYINYWKVATRNPPKALNIADKLGKKLQKLRNKKRKTKAVKKKIAKLKLRSSALSTVLGEIAMGGQAAASVTGGSELPDQAAEDRKDTSSDDNPSRLPWIVLGLSALRFLS